MQEHGFTVQAEDVQDLAAVKTHYAIPAELQSCHTAIVDGYLIEGHVPAQEIQRLLAERPDVVGLAVPGMPIGSPGMEIAEMGSEAFDVIAYDAAGVQTTFASYAQVE
ncbi:MAG: DUF411 domain-containing protein [Caldilineaceae bacterium]|nr:DUF411 domain-containing protein [Caldilineaceae bacterium]